MENGVVNLARKLVAREVESHVCCLDRSGEFAERLPAESRVHELAKPEGFKPGAVIALSRLIREVQPDVVHAHCLGPLIYTGLAKLKGPRFKLLMGEHGSLNDSDLAPKRLFLRRLLYRLCDGVHTVSKGLTDELCERGFGFAKPVTIVNGVDTERFSPVEDRASARRDIGLPEDAQVIGIVGRFIFSKRHDMLLDAFDQIGGRFPRAHLLIVGSRGDAEESIHARVAASPVKDRIVMPGFTPEPEAYYRAMDLMAMPSEKEGMSNALLESMACGVPTLCSDACGNSEVITHGKDGVMVDLSTASELARNIGELLENADSLRKLGQNARETVNERFSMASMSQRYLDVYNALIAGKLY